MPSKTQRKRKRSTRAKSSGSDSEELLETAPPAKAAKTKARTTPTLKQLSDLPVDVLELIMAQSGIAPHDLAACAGVSRAWHTASSSSRVWKALLDDRYRSGPRPLDLAHVVRGSDGSPYTTWHAYTLDRFQLDQAMLTLVQAMRFSKGGVRMVAAIHDQLDRLVHQQSLGPRFAPGTDLAGTPVGYHVLDVLQFLSTSRHSFLSERRAAWLLLRRLRWTWVLGRIERADDEPIEKTWALLSAARYIHADPVTQVVDPVLAQLDELAAGCPPVPAESTPRDRLLHLAQYLYGSTDRGGLGFRGALETYHELTNSYLDTVLATRAGLPISLCMLMQAVGRRLNPPVAVDLVGFPQHFLARFHDPHTKSDLYLDPFSYDAANARAWIKTTADCRAMLEVNHVPFLPQYLAVTPNSRVLARTARNLYWALTRAARVGQPLSGDAEHQLYAIATLALRLEPDQVNWQLRRIRQHLMDDERLVLDSRDAEVEVDRLCALRNVPVSADLDLMAFVDWVRALATTDPGAPPNWPLTDVPGAAPDVHPESGPLFQIGQVVRAWDGELAIVMTRNYASRRPAPNRPVGMEDDDNRDAHLPHYMVRYVGRERSHGTAYVSHGALTAVEDDDDDGRLRALESAFAVDPPRGFRAWFAVRSLRGSPVRDGPAAREEVPRSRPWQPGVSMMCPGPVSVHPPERMQALGWELGQWYDQLHCDDAVAVAGAAPPGWYFGPVESLREDESDAEETTTEEDESDDMSIVDDSDDMGGHMDDE
ncbi:hypothetical protein GGF32_004819 [Allomyces javanicus]|nr:hypothetical protein GGF32_004819 [Allomyces javanicus]